MQLVDSRRQESLLTVIDLVPGTMQYKSSGDVCVIFVLVGPVEAAAAAAPSGTMEGMLSRKHDWESTTKKSAAR